ncbi:MAG: adenine phosphoribosyltransferase [Crenarchaeota archaeon]|nr:adenine phosphoribosyltransferase [Thermoproteota archaeon]
MQVRTRLSRASLQFEAVELLNIARSLLKLSYRELSEITGFQESVLCRYANGDLLPSPETAMVIIGRLEQILSLENVLRKMIRVYESFIDFNRIITDSDILKLYARRVRYLFQDLSITKVLTAATDGVPLAVSAALALNADLAIAKQYRDVFEDSFYEATYIAESPPRKVTLYVPRSILNKNDRVLIVDDIVRSGRTIEALVNICRQAEAQIVGISILIALGSSWLKKIGDVNAKVDVVLSLQGSAQ